MIPEPFEYHLPKSLPEAAQLVSQFGADGKVLAGGHSLVPLMKLRLASPKHLIDLNGIADLSYIREEGGRIQIGAMTSHYQLESSELLKSKCPLLPETAGEIGDAQVRNKGTIGGSLAHSDPAGDWPAAMVALDAEILATSARGERWIRASEFFVEMLATALQPDEILTAIRVPALPAHGGEAYVKLHHPASGFAVVGVAARVTLDEKGSIAAIGVGVTGVGPKAYRAEAVEAVLRGKSPSAKRLMEACAHAADGVDANSDLFATADYRKHLAAVYTRRAIEKAVERAGAASGT
ncbi:MAG: FAD binding domain-containing protein [Deltaproteobacteria bacterium]